MLIWIGLTVFLSSGLFAHASLVTTILDAIENAVDCGSCHALVTVLQGVAFLGNSVFSDALVGVCQAVKAEDDDVCQGLLTEQGPIIAHDLRSISSLGQTATKFCNAVIGLCQEPDVNAFTVPIPKAVPSNPTVFTSTGKVPFRVVHFSDVHIDRMYTPGSEVNCTKPICCRNFADHTGPVEVAAGPLGSHGCDTPGTLSQSMLKAVAAENTRFSIFTGDVVEAAVWLVNQTEVTSDLQTFNSEMAEFVNSPVFPAIGNHEVAPINSFPRNTSSNAESSQWVFDTQSRGWTEWVGTAAAGEVQHMSGSYSAIPSGTNLSFWLYDSENQQPDPNGILAFAVQQLQAAEDVGQRAWIIVHMPPSSGDAFKDQSNYFNQVVQRYKNTIAGQFYGHSHVDEFAIAYSDFTNQNAANADSFAWIAPSLTPRNANPAFRVYDVDPDTYEIMDSRTFFSDMSDPSFQTSPTWKQEYSARDTYGPAIGGWPSNQSLSPTFWHEVTEAFETNDALFQQFNSFKTRGVGVVACTGDCKNTTICNLRALRTENGCHTATPGLNFKREEVDLTARGHADHCEGTGIRSIFNGIAMKSKTMDRDELRERLEAIFRDTVLPDFDGDASD